MCIRDSASAHGSACVVPIEDRRDTSVRLLGELREELGALQTDVAELVQGLSDLRAPPYMRHSRTQKVHLLTDPLQLQPLYLRTRCGLHVGDHLAAYVRLATLDSEAAKCESCYQ